MSKHPIGNALDVSGLKLADGKIISVQQPNGAEALLGKVRATAYGRFENEILRQEREILKRATTFFAKEGSR